MNWLLAVSIILIAAFAVKGRHDGFIKTVFSIFSLILALFITSALSPYVSRTLQNNNELMERITAGIEKTFDWEEKAKDEEKEKDEKKARQEELINDLKLPHSLKRVLLENNNSEAYKVLAAKSFSEYVSRYLAAIIINAASFALVFLITSVLLSLIAAALNIISRLPIINGLNKTAGLLVGVLNGLLVLWILCILLTVFSTTQTGQMLYGKINESKILCSIYNNNLLLKAITDIAKMLS